MSRRHAPLIALLAILAATPPAEAKQVNALTVCGADGCREMPRAIGRAIEAHGWAARATPPRPAPHFRFILGIGDDQRTFATDRVVYVPSVRAIGGPGRWSRVDRGTARKLEQALAKRRPLPAARLQHAVAVAEPGPSRSAEVVVRPAGSPPATSETGPGWWTLGAGVLLTAALAAGLWRLRRGRIAADRH